jgi:rSAM/selenodomain-associated transferase 2
MRLSIVVPAFNEAPVIRATLERLQPLRNRGYEVIVVDGGSGDATANIAQELATHVLQAARGRANQMNAGARSARGDVLLFLHADTWLPADADRAVLGAIARGRSWGRFDVRLTGAGWLLRLVAALMNQRSRWTGVCTGDQAMFVTREAFEQVGGYPDIALMEDIALSRALRRLGAPACVRPPVCTSARRWQSQGVLRTIALMWWLRLRYFFDASPDALARSYNRSRES